MRKSIKVLIVLAIIIAVVVTIIFVNLKKKPKLEEYVKPVYNYFAMYSLDGKVGVINKSGKIVLEANYSDVFIPNPSKPIFLCYENNGSYKILNGKGDELFKDYDEVTALQTSEMNLDFEKVFFRFKKDGKFGLIDYEGNIIVPANYDSLESLKARPGEILAKKDGKFGVIGADGNIKISAKYDSITGDEYFTDKYGYGQTGYIVGIKKENGFVYGYIDNNGEQLLKEEFESISRVSNYDESDIYLIVMNNGKKGVYKGNKQIIEQKYQNINYTEKSKLFVVKRNSKYGIFNNKGKEVLAVKYKAYNLAGDYISVETESGNKELYDINGNKVSNLNYKSVQASRKKRKLYCN